MTALQDFQNRLLKSTKHFSKWASRQGLEAYRVYDRDIPQYPVAVDVYGNYIHIAEYDTGWQQSDEEHAKWVSDLKESIAQTLNIPLERIVFKLRQRQKGSAQYTKTGVQGTDFIVSEFGHRFWVNLEAYLDTGLFLDHRNTRLRVGKQSANKRVLNLYAYTGSFTVYAAMGGARESVTVDLSNTYLDWAARNFELNGIDPSRHTRVRADVFRYLDDAVAAKERFDLIVMDPPSFSNSAKMVEVLDIQRDHSSLIEDCLELLNPGGVLYFSTNLRGFKLDAPYVPLCRDISHQSVPEDFRNKQIHQCFLFEAR